MKRPFLSKISKIHRSLIKSIKETVSTLGLEFYPSGYTDSTESDNRLKLAKLSKPLRFKLPVGSDEEYLVIEYFTKSGFVSDAYAGGACIESWITMPVENLEKIDLVLKRRAQLT